MIAGSDIVTRIVAVATVWVLSVALPCYGQKPVITSIDKVFAGNEEIVSITGSAFGADENNLVVFFGAVQGEITFVSDQFMEVKVPAGTTYDKISITHLPSGLTGYSSKDFFISFGGVNGITPAQLEGQVDFQSGSGLYDLCSCDFNGDGKTDIATANEGLGNTMSVFKNTTTAPTLPTINFNHVPLLINTKTAHVTCGDLNGDGKPDLVSTEGGDTGDRVFFFKNTSSSSIVSFTLPPSFVKLTGKKVKRVVIRDLDNDGKSELIVSSRNSNIITVLKNISTLSAINFSSTPIFLTVSGAASTDALAVNDLNGDGLMDIVTSQFVAPSSNLYILRNTSTPGNITFAASVVLLNTLPDNITVASAVANIQIADLNSDNKPDIVASLLVDNRINLFTNTTTGGTISFSTPTALASDGNPFGLSFGDIDGDSKPDIVVASLTKKELKIYNNNSTSSSLVFQPVIIPTTFINRHVVIGDVDGDGKPDISFTSIDELITPIPASKISVFRNNVCLKPQILPEDPLTICSSFPLQLTTAVAAGTTFTWKNNGTTVSTGTNNFFDVVASGNYTVTASDACATPSNSVQITVEPGTLAQPPVATNTGPICAGSSLTLSVNNVGTTYEWNGPNFTSTQKEPVIANFQPANEGRYTVDIYLNGCLADQVSTVAEVISVPAFIVSSSGASVVCAPDTRTLTLSPAPTTFTYQWFDDSGLIPGETGSTFDASTSGNYFIKAEYTANPACAATQTAPVAVTFALPIISDFTFEDFGCVGQDVAFTNLSTKDPAVPTTVLWEFGDGVTDANVNAVHRYQTANSFTIKLSMSYADGACLNQNSKTLIIENAPTATITAPDNKFSICEGETLTLGVTGGTFTDYNWNTSESTPTINVSEARNYIVNVTSANGCVVTAAKQVTAFDPPVVTVTATPPSVNEGESSQLEANGLNDYEWDLDATLSNLLIPNPVATPTATTQYKVHGTDNNGCVGEGLVEVIVKSGSPLSKLTTSNFFSPDNGDEINKFWNVDRIEEFPECEISIFDDKGIKVFQAKPYLNNWDGTFNGKPLPDGVYYFIIKCDGDTNRPKAGSITLLR